ncbi:LSU ribosomal protein L18p (L5e) [invertebrate metagenome]|uniref:LSU ribosomal protein L18p (L5e) n=1 Tax=invertebrate metagenome TaxID=1711999 RepID=A0A484H4G6_9ZZZZ
MRTAQDAFVRRRWRTRFNIKRKSGGKLRLSVHRTDRHIYAQIIDDSAGRTLAAASTLDKKLREQLRTGTDKVAAAAVGTLIAQRALAVGVKEVFFDRGGFLFHGRVQALADAARNGGLVF